MIVKHVTAFLALLSLTCVVCSRLPVVTRMHVPAGTSREETWKVNVLLSRPDEPGKFYNTFDSKLNQIVKSGIRFESSGPLRVTSSEIDLRPTMVTWEAQKPNGMRDAHYSAPGLEMVAHVKWQAVAQTASTEQGEIRMFFSPQVRNAECEPLVHGGFEQAADGSHLALRVALHASDAGLFLARCLYALVLALPLAAFPYSLAWAVVLHFRVKKRKAEAALLASEGEFPAPPPMDDWRQGWTMFCLISGIGCFILTVPALTRQSLPSFHGTFMLVLLGGGLIAGLMIALSHHLTVLSVKMDAETLSCAKGRQQPLAWETARWEEIKEMKPVAMTIKGMTHRWIKVVFPSGRVYRVINPECMKQITERIKARLAGLRP